MQIHLHNSLSRKAEPFTPIKNNLVRMYSCGPTVYNYAHIGNMRAFLFADLLQRALRTVGGYEVRWVMNITNIDDKTIRDSSPGSPAWSVEMGVQTDDPMENLMIFTQYYEKAFLEDISQLGIKTKDFYSMPKATEYIEQMQDLINNIYNNGFAYISEGSVYFNVSEWRKKNHYGRLKNIDFENFRLGARIDADEYEKEDASDFALWKASKTGEPYWEFELDGKNCSGRPGWHLECSTMEKELLDLPFDIHTGGIDLKFPHHEDEIAQSHAGYGIDPTAFWCHNEFLEVEGEKMSKTKGNFFTLRDLLEKSIDPLDIRYSMFSTHYGSTYNFTFDGMKAAHKSRQRIQEYIWALHTDSDEGSAKPDVNAFRNDVFSELANDLHTPKALALVFTFINNHLPEKLSAAAKGELITFFEEFNQIFDVWELNAKKEEKQEIPQEIIALAEKRLLAKKEKNFALADSLRDKIKDAGFQIKDTKDSYILEKID